MKFTDQIERELMPSSTPQGGMFGGAADTFTINGAWRTAGAISVAAAIWMLAWR
jgi:hypothetical protein